MKQLSWKHLLICSGLVFWCGWAVTDAATVFATSTGSTTGQEPSPNVWVDKIKVPGPKSSSKKPRGRIRRQPRSRPIVAPLLTMQYQILLKKQDARLWTNVDPRTNFYNGDVLQLELTVNQNGYSYIFAWSEDKAGRVLAQPLLVFPDWQVNNGVSRVEKNQRITIPSDPNDPQVGLLIDEPAGVEKILVIFSREPIKGMPNRLLKPRDDQESPELTFSWDDILTLRRLCSPQNMKRKTWFDLSEPERKLSSEQSVWVINTNLQDNDQIIEEIALDHR